MLKIYNTLTRAKEEFKLIKEGRVSFYQCGPTVYWTQHIGNMRAMVMADLIRRTLEYLGNDVTFVRNYTDVGHLLGDNQGDADTGEDRMDKSAKQEGKVPQEIADKYIKIFEEDTRALNVLSPTHMPRATSYIPQIQEMIGVLIDKGYAYITQKAVYFDVSRAKDYNKLNKQNLEETREGAGSGEVQDPEKKNSQDFVLWFFKTGVHSTALQTWESPFGVGFPGWHIECSAMIKSLLGDTIDIHMGGVEHISIHHTNEIAQSESANDAPLANYWLHNEHLTVDGKKMAKSEGTGYALSEITDRGCDPLALRYFFLQAHYHSKQNFTWDALEAAGVAYKRLLSIVYSLRQNKESSMVTGGKEDKRQEYLSEVRKALEDDFNIPQVLAIAWEAAKSNLPPQDKLDLLLDFDRVLGLGLDKAPPKPEFERTPQEVEELVRKRNEYRRVNQYQEADKIRQEIEKLGYEVSDTTKFGSDVRRKK
ncbi:MAG: cysteine--tRNA ligase [Patescibacteria group bacterium]